MQSEIKNLQYVTVVIEFLNVAASCSMPLLHLCKLYINRLTQTSLLYFGYICQAIFVCQVITHLILLTQATQQHIFCPVWGHKTFPHDLRFCLKFMAHFMSFYGCTLNQIMEKIVIMSGYWVALICNFFYFLLSKESKGIGKFYLATLVHPVRPKI